MKRSEVLTKIREASNATYAVHEVIQLLPRHERGVLDDAIYEALCTQGSALAAIANLLTDLEVSA